MMGGALIIRSPVLCPLYTVLDYQIHIKSQDTFFQQNKKIFFFTKKDFFSQETTI